MPVSPPFCTPSLQVAAWQTLAVHTWLAQSDAWRHSTHAAPLHMSGALQVPGSVVPAGTVVQVPRLPATLQARQVPVQAVSQHTPSTQWLFTHWLSPPHATPSASWATQLPPLQ
jgi:hypothetical protein